MQKHAPEHAEEPQLAPPGGGIPLLERLVAKYYFVNFKFPRMEWARATRYFESETAKITALAATLTPEKAATKILVPKMRGLEDSSRYWSPAMLLEHLMIVAPGMADVTILLTQGRAPGRDVDIAKLKPSGKVFDGMDGAKMSAIFSQKMKDTLARIEKEARDRASTFKQVHPWFGPITAHQWNWLMATHQSIHRRQLEKMLSE